MDRFSGWTDWTAGLTLTCVDGSGYGDGMSSGDGSGDGSGYGRGHGFDLWDCGGYGYGTCDGHGNECGAMEHLGFLILNS